MWRSNATNIRDFPVNFYPVYVDFNSDNLRLVQNHFCQEAYSMTRKDMGKKAIQVRSFISYERAEQLSKFLQKNVGSGEVGLPRLVESPKN